MSIITKWRDCLASPFFAIAILFFWIAVKIGSLEFSKAVWRLVKIADEMSVDVDAENDAWEIDRFN